MNTDDSNTAALPCADMPPPTVHHAWLEKFAGEWETSAEVIMGPDAPPMVSQGRETARMLGGFWVVLQGRSEVPDFVFENVLCLGYDAETSKYIGTWIDSMTGFMWRYIGTVNEAGDTLALDTEGPCPKNPGSTRKFKEVYQFLDADTRHFTSSILGEDGTWTACVTVKARRKA